jgi:ElaB/YqjD/DUF883 family membrane-anchored ribosome-binding protein
LGFIMATADDSSMANPAAASGGLGSNDAPKAAGTTNGGGAHAASPPPVEWVQRAADNAHDMIDKVAEQAVPRMRHLHRRVSDAGQRLHSGGDAFNALSREWAESARCTVREQPLTALAIAAAVGLLLGRLSR